MTVDVLFVSGDALWPPHHGGRIRGGHIVEELAKRLRVLVLAPVEASPPVSVPVERLPDRPASSRRAGVVSGRPRLGRALMGPARLAALGAVLARERPATVVFASSYLAAMVGPLPVPAAVDFVDVEVRRTASFAQLGGTRVRSRAAFGWEYLKARRWEPHVARRSVVAATPAVEDVALLASWGAPAIHVPNGADRHEFTPSPVDGPVTFVASFGYHPNTDAARFLLQDVWPRLQRAEPHLRLRLAGRDAGRDAGRAVQGLVPPSVEVVPDPVDIDAVYREASVVVAPVRAGGGSQLKVTEALSRGRAVVATSFSAKAVPPAATGAVLVADGAEPFTAHVLHFWRDLAARRAAEKALADPPPVPTWEEACVPLGEALERIVRTR